MAVSVTVLPPFTETVPLPLMAFPTVIASLLLKVNAALFVTGPLPRLPAVLPLPTCSVPSLMVVAPL